MTDDCFLSPKKKIISKNLRFVVIASTCELSRKILNSPVYVVPTVVDSMRTILCPDNWVFMEGKEHVEYRKGLNVLFTRKALG